MTFETLSQSDFLDRVNDNDKEKHRISLGVNEALIIINEDNVHFTIPY